VTHEQVPPRHEALGDGAADAQADQVLAVVLGLGGRVDAAEAGAQGLVDQLGRGVLLPGRAVQEPRHRRRRGQS